MMFRQYGDDDLAAMLQAQAQELASSTAQMVEDVAQPSYSEPMMYDEEDEGPAPVIMTMGLLSPAAKAAALKQGCPAGFTASPYGCIPTPKCPSGYNWDGEKCTPIPTCPSGYLWNGEDCVPAGSIPTCPTGYYWNGRDCVAGEQGSCSPGFVWIGEFCAAQQGYAGTTSVTPGSAAYNMIVTALQAKLPSATGIQITQNTDSSLTITYFLDGQMKTVSVANYNTAMAQIYAMPAPGMDTNTMLMIGGAAIIAYMLLSK